MNNRREILFLYDVTDSNPNGDPDDGNRPRMDESGVNIVTDVRLKRTIRDYWLRKYEEQGTKDVLVKRSIDNTKMTVLTMEDLVKKALGLGDITKDNKATALKLIIEKIPEKFIDVRCFGAALTVSKANHSFTGPVQFSIGRSLNIPKVKSYTITTTFASGEDKSSGTFGEFHVVDYSLILFHGIACEQSAKVTKMTDDDLLDLYRGLWNGTRLLNTRSKVNHHPRLLLSVVSKTDKFQIGGLQKKLMLAEKENLTKSEDAKVILDRLIERLQQYKDSIEKIEVLSSDDIVFTFKEEPVLNLVEFLKDKGFTVNELSSIVE